MIAVICMAAAYFESEICVEFVNSTQIEPENGARPGQVQRLHDFDDII